MSLTTIGERKREVTPDFKIGDLAKITGKSARALRLYEEMGLLRPGSRTAGGFRVYGQDAVERVRWIEQLQDVGLSLSDIKDVVAVAAEAPVPRERMAHVREMMKSRLDDVDAQLERLTKLRGQMTEALAYLDGCSGCATDAEGPTACLACDEHEASAPPLVRGINETARDALDRGR